ncbi:MAG: T9SS type A sorting domain-containing protein [Flavobacteriales bacterium]|nr:T9SS type A sorting domain-containing protein [Flavobacteriales bacterium]
MTNNLTFPVVGLAVLLAMGTEVSAQDRTSFGGTVRPVRSAASRPQLPLPFRGGAPANDDCSGAETIGLVHWSTCGTSATMGDNGTAVPSVTVPSCDIAEDGVQDVWYTFNSGSYSMVYITLTPGMDMDDHGFAVYDACGGNELACEIIPDGVVGVPVAAGADYLIQVYSNLDWGVGGSFTLCVAYEDADPPANDACSSVAPQALAIGGSVTFNGTTVGATVDGDFVDPDNAPAVWHGITLSTCATLTMDFCGTTPAFTNGYGMIGTSCPLDGSEAIYYTTANSTACGDDNYTITYVNVPAGSYYIPVWSEMGVAYGEYTLNVSATECINAPVNDDCTGAISVTPTTICDPVAGTTLMATESMPAEECSTYTGNANNDVWYSFVATSSVMTISTTTAFDGVLLAYRGTCASLQPIDCIDDALSGEEETLILSGLTPTNTYYYRIYSYPAAAPADPTFTTCVTGSDGTGLAELDVVANWSLFPNPGNGLLNIVYGGASEQVVIEVLDLSGRLVHSEQRHLSNGQTAALNLSGRLATGTYNVRLANSTGRSTQRVIVE